MSKVTKEMIEDWIENPVTERLASLIREELEEIQDTPVTTALVYGDPTKTQENLVNLEAREMVFNDLVLFLTGDWSYFEEDEDEQ